MAKVSLRIYNREIEGLIDQAHINEAIAHCHHILRTFPKHLATYRLLGKAYLELKRYGEAVDIFSRVLMSVPDDFVSHVGMSIIRDEENKLDDAIWHMQRAFEAQPSNSAIQGELQRLYGRRDGMEPPKIRMTRGALAHMYVQGELYPQAIAEIRAVLAQEPDRADMQVLLARAYFHGGQKADASDMCMQLLKRYLYCYDANCIMVDLLPATAGAVESTQVYRMRVGELDPYTAFAKGSVFLANEVPDASINLERLDYKEEDAPATQSWGASSSSLGLGSGASSAPMLSSSNSEPDWLKNASDTSASKSGEDIPDFLRAAGWGESTGPEQPTSFFDDTPASGDLTPADIPDWLKGQVPTNVSQPAAPQPASSQSIETPDWLSGLDTGSETSSASGDIPDWLSGLGTAGAVAAASSAQSEPAPAQPGNVPDWLSGLGDAATPSEPASSIPPAQPGNVPDWLSGLGDDATPSEPVSSIPPAQPGNVPDWLSGLGDEPTTTNAAQTDDVSDWLSGLDSPAPVAAPTPATPSQSSDVPEWLSGLGDAEAAKSAQPDDVMEWLNGLDTPKASVAPAAAASGDVPDWLRDIDDSQTPSGNGPDSLFADAQAAPAQSDDLPAWMSGLGETSQPAASQPTSDSDLPAWMTGIPDAQPEELGQTGEATEWLHSISTDAPLSQTPAPSVESLGSTAQEQDDAVAWLESLAAKHGAKPEELVTDPNKRSETPPEWVAQAQNIEQQTPAAQTPAPSVESLGSTTQEQDDAVAWLESLAAKHGAKPEELVTDPNKRSETPPEWVSQAQSIGEAQSAQKAEEAPIQSEAVENALNIGEQFFAEFENASKGIPSSSTTGTEPSTDAWLREFEETENQAVFSSAEGSFENQEQPRSDIPDWLNESHPSETDGQFAFEKSGSQKSDLPDWLNVEENAFPQDASAASQNDLSNWLSSLDNEPGLPFEEMPTPDSIYNASKAVSKRKPADEEPVMKKPDLPEWLSNVDADDQWQAPASESTEEPVTASENENLPDWLHNLEEEEAVVVDEDSPRLVDHPVSSSDWKPMANQTPEPKKEVSPVEPRKPFVPPPAEPRAEAEVQPQQMERPVEERRTEKPQSATSRKKASVSAKQRQPEAQGTSASLSQAKGELDRGDIPAALDHYKKLIKRGKHIEETIRDLTESIYRYPVEVGIWQTLGDAYMRANRLKEALEAYNKAEELIR